jgi:hypothetical protein
VVEVEVRQKNVKLTSALEQLRDCQEPASSGAHVEN